jgi:ABC-2 type transport system ATP-binding protein
VLECRGLTKHYGAKRALESVDLSIGQGELVGLLGPNGAGKTTLIKSACGLLRPSAGSVTVYGHPAGSPQALSRIGYLAELFRFPGWLSADEVLELHQGLSGSQAGESERAALLSMVGLADARLVRVDAMSKGMQQRLGIAQALVGAPHLLLLDEPASALDPAGRRAVRELLLSLKQRGISVLLNSHLLSEVELVCDRVVLLVDGRVVRSGRPGDLARPRGVEVETGSGPRVWEGATREHVPQIVAELVAAGEQVYGVRVLASSLEDVYLEAVGA